MRLQFLISSRYPKAISPRPLPQSNIKFTTVNYWFGPKKKNRERFLYKRVKIEFISRIVNEIFRLI